MVQDDDCTEEELDDDEDEDEDEDDDDDEEDDDDEDEESHAPSKGGARAVGTRVKRSKKKQTSRKLWSKSVSQQIYCGGNSLDFSCGSIVAMSWSELRKLYPTGYPSPRVFSQSFCGVYKL